MIALSQITENRKVEARKPLIFQDTVFEFSLEKATLRQSHVKTLQPVQHYGTLWESESVKGTTVAAAPLRSCCPLVRV